MNYCGERVIYYKHHTGLCMHPPHGDDVDHLVEVVSIDTQRVDYGGFSMIMHLQDPSNYRLPRCWNRTQPDADRHESFQSTGDVDNVTCADCLRASLHDLKATPSFDLWLDGPEFDESAGWRQPVVFDFDRFKSDDYFAGLVSDYITRALANLAKEVEEIGTVAPPQDDA